MKHPADGIYYVTGEMLKRRGACNAYRSLMRVANANDMDEPILITRDILRKFQAEDSGFAWAMDKMLDSGIVTGAEAHFYYVSCSWDLSKGFMDILQARAKREGRL